MEMLKDALALSIIWIVRIILALLVFAVVDKVLIEGQSIYFLVEVSPVYFLAVVSVWTWARIRIDKKGRGDELDESRLDRGC